MDKWFIFLRVVGKWKEFILVIDVNMGGKEKWCVEIDRLFILKRWNVL